MTDRPTEPKIDVGNADLLLSTTRAVRRRLDLERPVEPDVILECLRLAVQAPTASNSQTWRWVVVTDPDLRREIAEVYRSGGMDYLRGSEAGLGDSDSRILESALYLAENIERVPVFVIPCLENPGGLDFTDEVEVLATLGSVMQAAWSFQLALRARGLGSVWTTFHLEDAGTVAELLGLPDDITQIALIPVAYTKGTDFKPARRPPVEQITHWNGWGETDPPR